MVRQVRQICTAHCLLFIIILLLTAVVPFSVVFRVYDSDGNEYLDSQVLTGPYVICLETDLKSVFGWLHSDIRIIHQGQVV